MFGVFLTTFAENHTNSLDFKLYLFLKLSLLASRKRQEQEGSHGQVLYWGIGSKSLLLDIEYVSILGVWSEFDWSGHKSFVDD